MKDLRELVSQTREWASENYPPCVVEVVVQYPDAADGALIELVEMHDRKECDCK